LRLLPEISEPDRSNLSKFSQGLTTKLHGKSPRGN
jgi:hypothetical protein